MQKRSYEIQNTSILRYSVVATTFNDENSIERFIHEITYQTIPPTEIVIADGGSKDKTVEIIKSLSKMNNVPIKVISGKRLNIAEGYNEAIKNACEPYIGITGIGNRYKTDYFEKLITHFCEKKIDGVYSPIRGLDSTTFSKKYNAQLLNGEYGQRMTIASNHGALIKKHVFEELNFFYEKFVYAGEDTEFYLLAKNSGYKFELVPDADVRWETPESYSEYKKQIKVYTIASLQINPSAQKQMVKKYLLKSAIAMCGFIAILLLLILSTNMIIKLSAGLIIVMYAIILRKKTKPLRVVQKILQIYYTLVNLRYGNIEYQVRR